ncbi:MAG: helix-turn-helix domain-containing protein [Erysipelotrichales bacterium]|nr:helix-turn-helix domain-containing protein [Erysipelotrichales bacterium]
MKFNEKLKELRIQKNLTQDDVASHLHISRQSVSKWEQGINEPDIQTLKQLCLLFEVPIDELIDDDREVVLSKEEKKRRVSKNLFIAQITICLFNILNILCLLVFIPSKVVTHYDFAGNATYGSKFTYLLFLTLPIIVILISALFKLFTKNNIHYKKHAVFTNCTFLIMQILFFIGTFIPMVLLIEFDEITFSRFMICEIALIFICATVSTNPIVNKNPNFYAGFRTSFTLSNKEAWHKVNMLQCILGFIAAVIMLVASLVIKEHWVIYSIFLVLISCIITYIYHEVLRHKMKKINT